MKLSIFSKAKPLPSSKEEKTYESQFASMPHLPEVIEIATEDDLIHAVTNFVYSPSIFNGYRKEANFKSADFMVLDIDEGLTIPEAEKRCEELKLTVLCVPSTSHTPEKHKFRLIFPLLKTITDQEIFMATINKLAESFPECDPACLHSSRFYFSSRMDDGFWLEADLLEPVVPVKEEKRSFGPVDTSEKVKTPIELKQLITDLYGEERTYINEHVHHFLTQAHTGLPGTWVCDLNNACFILSLQGIPEDDILDLMEYLAPRGQLTKRDVDTIKRAIRDGNKKREEV